MRSPITKFAAAAVIIVAVVISISVFNKSVPTVIPTAFGIEQVIAASDNIRYLHAIKIWADRSEPDEFWVKSNGQGRAVKARYYLPVTEDGAKLITWTPTGTEIWFKNKHWLAIIQSKSVESWMQRILEQCQPKFVMQELLGEQKAGKVEVNLQKQPDRQKFALIVATYKDKPQKRIYYIDQATDLVTRVEHYRTGDSNEALYMTVEFSDYNVPIDDKMFSLKDEVPKDVRIADRLNQICGVPQGNMTDEQAAAETIRQYLQALIDKDYKKAGLICCGMLEKYAKQDFGWCNISSIISIGPAIHQPDWRKQGYKVPYVFEIFTKEGKKTILKNSDYVSPGDDEMHPNRWNITSGGLESGMLQVQTLPDNEKYEEMTPKEAAEAFFKACAEKNWDEFSKFWPASVGNERMERMKEQMQEFLGGLEIISIGEPFKEGKYPGWFVPYEIKLPPMEFNVRLSNKNAAGRLVITGVCDSNLQPLREMEWNREPEILPDNEVYAKMSPEEVIKAFNEASLRQDANEMRKFAPDDFVKEQNDEFDTSKGKPSCEVIGKAVWSDEQSAYFVKCRYSGQVKKWNLAIRNDNSANRYMFDGGI